jgi:urease accessory protein
MLAHLMNTGLGPYYDGLLHLFVTPEDLLPVVALALLAGLRGPGFGRFVLFALPLAWLAGTACGRGIGALPLFPAAAAILTIVAGAAVAADRPFGIPIVGGLAIAVGLLHGAWNGSELTGVRSGAIGNALGVATAIFVVVALLSALVSSLRVAWTHIVVRVAGSWIAAAGIFMVGWALRRG